jgi:peptidoglycan/LPS O-acetylase OafA/YrhL
LTPRPFIRRLSAAKKFPAELLMKTPTINAERLYALDVLRGIAALSVVFWHWQHFFYVGDDHHHLVIWQQPLFDQLRIFYTRGALAVELFFCISGFVFFWLFSQKIAERRISPYAFFIDRFSRLYPLHFLTFIAVALLQAVYLSNHDNYFVYQLNDAYHFLLNLFLAPSWGFEKGWSFNAPIWSVSVEVLLYATFFLVFSVPRLRLLLIPLMILTGFSLYPSQYKLGTGFYTFFCGGAGYIVLNYARQHASIKSLAAAGVVLSAACWAYIWMTPGTGVFFLTGIAFPLSISTLAAIGFTYTNFMKPFAAIGDISYSSYLLHFPLQISFALAVDHLGYGREIFYSPWMLLFFMTALIAISALSHRLFEVPVQRLLRRKFQKPKSITPTADRLNT